MTEVLQKKTTTFQKENINCSKRNVLYVNSEKSNAAEGFVALRKMAVC